MAAAVETTDAKNLPPGFRFHPTDEEIVGHYLKNKVLGKKPEIEVIREIDLYKCEPWDLPEKSILPSRDLEWYFFSARDKKYPNGSRSNRATEKGYWKATGKDRKVNSQANKIGMKKTLVFYKGRAPNGERSEWLMHEYRLDETQCKGAPHLQDLYVVCRVFNKKGKQGSKNEEQYGTPNDEIDFSLSKSNLYPTKVNSLGEIEEQSEERSSPVMQEDDTLTTGGLPSDTSSEILDNKTEENVCFDDPLDSLLESLQDRSNPDCRFSLRDEIFVNQNADTDLGFQGLPSESVGQMWELDDLPQWTQSFDFANSEFPFGWGDGISHVSQVSEQDNLGYPYFVNSSDAIPGGYLELDDLLRSIPEPNNSEPCFVNDGMPDNGIHFQSRSRSATWNSHEQPLLSQGSAIRRVRLQIHKTDESVDRNKEHEFIANCQSECHDCNSDDSETVTQLEDSVLAPLPRQTSSPEEDDADSGFIHDSSGAYKNVANDHCLTLAPAQSLVFDLLPEETLEESENSLNAPGSEEKSILGGTPDNLKSSGCGQLLCAHAGPQSATVVQDNSESPREHSNKSVGNGAFITVTREQTLIEELEHVEKCEVAVSEFNSKVPNEVCEFGDSSFKGEKLISHGTSFTELPPGSVVSSASVQGMQLVNEGMKSSATVSSKKGNLASETADNLDSIQARFICSHSTDMENTGISCKESIKYAGIDLILHGLKRRGKSRTEDMVFESKKKSMDVTKSFSYFSSKEGAKRFINSQKACGIFKWFSELQSRPTESSNRIFLLIGLFVTAILVLFIPVIWQLGRSSSPIIL